MMNINDALGRWQRAPHGTVGFSDGKGWHAHSMQRRRGLIWVRCLVRGSLTWVPLDNLSPALWKFHREKITTALKEEKLRYFQYMEDNQTLANAEGELVDTQKMLSQLYEKLEDEDKKEFLKNNPKSKLATSVCIGCMSLCEKKHGCPHPACPGLCNGCNSVRVREVDKMEKSSTYKCPACDQKQIIQCPICLEDKKPRETTKADGGCSHRVCWQCFGQAYKWGSPINDCPLCRGTFFVPVNADGDYT